MAPTIDVYRDWLEIAEPARPLNYYQILKLKQFEDDAARIRSSYRKLNAEVRKYAAGQYAAQSQDLLNELAKAMLCLTDNTRKSEYDASLGRTAPQTGKTRTLEEILVGRKVVDTAQLDRARRYAKTVGVDIRDAVMQQKLAPAELVMQAFAESVGLPYVDVGDVSLDPDLIAKVPAVLARQHSCAPLMVDDGQLLIVSPNAIGPDVEEQLRLRLGLPVRTVLCTPAGIHELISKHFPREAAAAQLAAGPARPASAAKSANKAAATPEKSTAAKAPPADPATKAEDRRRRMLMSLMAFNFGVVGFMIVASLVGWTLSMSFWSLAIVGVVLGGIAAGITWMVS